jgi:uncharacterized protein YlxP (DUF503 family)
MHAAALRIELRIRDARSLKQKRHIVKSIIAQLSNSHNVAASEVDDHEKWNKATLGVVAVGPQAGHVTRVLHGVRRHLEARPDVEVLRIAEGYLDGYE